MSERVDRSNSPQWPLETRAGGEDSCRAANSQGSRRVAEDRRQKNLLFEGLAMAAPLVLGPADNDHQPLQSLVSASRRVWQRIFERWRPLAPFPARFQSKRITRLVAKKGVRRSDPPLARRKDEQDSCLADDRGRPVVFALTLGNVADGVMAIPLLSAVAKSKCLLADKAYDADSLCRWLKQRKIRAAIPSTASRRTPYLFDRAAYKKRHRTHVPQA